MSFTLEGELYGLPIEAVGETLHRCVTIALPGLPPHVHGASNLRGDVIAILDPRRILGMPGARAARRLFECVVVVRVPRDGGAEDERVGLVVDEVHDILFEGEDYSMHPTPANTPAEARPFIRGVAEAASHTIVLLDAMRLVEHGEPRNGESR